MKRTNDGYFFTCPICGKKPYVKIFNINYGVAYCKGTLFKKHPLIHVKTEYCNPSNLFNVLSNGWNDILWEPLNKLPIDITVNQYSQINSNGGAMKLFKVNYIDDCDFETYLTVGDSKEEVEERVVDELHSKCSCLMDAYVCEINEIDGHKIIVE